MVPFTCDVTLDETCLFITVTYTVLSRSKWHAATCHYNRKDAVLKICQKVKFLDYCNMSFYSTIMTVRLYSDTFYTVTKIKTCHLLRDKTVLNYHTPYHNSIILLTFWIISNYKDWSVKYGTETNTPANTVEGWSGHSYYRYIYSCMTVEGWSGHWSVKYGTVQKQTQ